MFGRLDRDRSHFVHTVHTILVPYTLTQRSFPTRREGLRGKSERRKKKEERRKEEEVSLPLHLLAELLVSFYLNF